MREEDKRRDPNWNHYEDRHAIPRKTDADEPRLLNYDLIMRLLQALEDSENAAASAVADPYDVTRAWSVARVACEAREFANMLSLQRSELTDRLARLCNVSEQCLVSPRDTTINIPDARRDLRFEVEQSRALIAAIEGSIPACTDADLANASNEARARLSEQRAVSSGDPAPRATEE